MTINPDAIRGVRTKWRNPSGDVRSTVQPDLMGLSLSDFITKLINRGVEVIELNVDPGAKFGHGTAPTAQELDDYIAAFYAYPRSTTQQNTVTAFEETYIEPDDKRLTTDQRDRLLRKFVERVASLSPVPNIKFVLHQRRYFDRSTSENEARAVDFATDMANVLKRVCAAGLDGWVHGVRLGENNQANMTTYLGVLVSIASKINTMTASMPGPNDTTLYPNGWLKSHLFLANGGKMGAEYVGIGTALSSFFPDISAKTNHFSFCYKLMVAENTHGGLEGQYQNWCDNNNTTDDSWNKFLGSHLGFFDVRSYIKDNRGTYPQHANIIFVGDSGDAVRVVTQLTNGAISDKASMAAVKGMWPKTDGFTDAGFRGRFYMNGYTRTSYGPWTNADHDDGLTFFESHEDGSTTFMQDTKNYWAAFPVV